ncbi:hypothetical protein QTG54_004416 [Skeletonema marinoi]|uniref:AMP-dependent synthetase/ligase domain-containing protein n=1 Tax=Skeletonema marinoi TaxID=267567 RepID=A0AAD9DGM3_9STRA|nr:hypothetical protein QTG54_004416 [Skeletonema marinoi]
MLHNATARSLMRMNRMSGWRRKRRKRRLSSKPPPKPPNTIQQHERLLQQHRLALPRPPLLIFQPPQQWHINTRDEPTSNGNHQCWRCPRSIGSDHPHQEIIRYEHKNVKWTLKHVNYYADALACGLVDSGLQPGDVVLSWLPMHLAEQHILQFACSKAGFLLYHLDPNPALAKSNPDKAKPPSPRPSNLQMPMSSSPKKQAMMSIMLISLKGLFLKYAFSTLERACPSSPPCIRVTASLIKRACTHSNISWYLAIIWTACFVVQSKALDGKTPLLGELVLDNDGIPVKTGKVMTMKRSSKQGLA